MNLMQHFVNQADSSVASWGKTKEHVRVPPVSKAIRAKRETINGVPHKECTKCWRMTPLTEFHKSKDYSDGRATKCALCSRMATRNFYAKKTTL